MRYLIMILTISIFACCDSDPIKMDCIPELNGEAQIIINSEIQLYNSAFNFNDEAGLNFYLPKYSIDSCTATEGADFRRLKFDIMDTINLDSLSIGSYSHRDYDVFFSAYKIHDNNSWIKIKEVNSDTTEFEGSFHFSFLKSSGSEAYPDTLVLDCNNFISQLWIQ